MSHADHLGIAMGEYDRTIRALIPHDKALRHAAAMRDTARRRLRGRLAMVEGSVGRVACPRGDVVTAPFSLNHVPAGARARKR